MASKTPSRLAATAAALLVLILVPGCASPTGPGYDLLVEVRRAPINPVEIEGQDNSAPVEHAVVRIRVGGAEKARGSSNSMGIASFSLPAGSYRVEVVDCPLSLGLPDPVDVQLGPGAVGPHRLVCDTGIR